MSNSRSAFDRPYNEQSSCSFTFGDSSDVHATTIAQQQESLLSQDEKAKEKEIDNLLATAFKGLSFEERQRNLEILHGVSSNGVQENDELIQNATAEFVRHLNAIKAGTAYETAEKIDPSYVNDRTFQLMFLRGNEFRSKAAADQAIRFLDMKLRLFGKDKLTQQITLNDLDEDDRDFLKTGALQLIGKDQTGRVIWFQLPGLRKFKTIENELRARFYLGMNLLKSEEVQRKGVVIVTYAVGEFRDSMNGAGYVDVVKVTLALPLYLCSFHNCMDNPPEKLLGTVALSVIPASIRSRSRIHLGSHLETQYILSGYGIPPQLFPFTPMANGVKLDRHLQWYKAALANETCNNEDKDDVEIYDTKAQRESAIITDIKKQDILYDFGRTLKHEGNEQLRALVREQSALYDACNNMGKRDLIEKIVKHVKDGGGRFLQIDEASAGYKELSMEKTQAKVSQMFRNYRRSKGNSGVENETRQDLAGTSKELIDKPGPNDVQLGRVGKGKGNDLMLLLVRKLGDQYDGGTRVEKSRIADSIVQQIKREGGRFVQPMENGGWEEIPNEVARTKVAKCFRNSRRYKNK